MMKTNKDLGTKNEVLLITVSSDRDAESTIYMLHDAGIPTLKKHRGSGEYCNILMGYSPFGIDLLVPFEMYEKAKAVIDGITFDNSLKEIEEDTSSVYDSTKRGIRIFVRISLVLGALFFIYSMISSIIL